MIRALRTAFPAFLLPLLFLLSSCGSERTLTGHETLPMPDLSAAPGSAAFPDAGAVILRDEGTMEVFTQGDIPFSVFERHRTIKILNARGHGAGNVVIPYGGRSQVDAVEARTILPDGTIIPLDEKNIYDVTLYPNFIFFSDQRAKIFTMPGIEDGAVLEVKYRMTLFDRTLWHAWSFQDSYPTLESRFTLVRPAEWDVLWRAYGTDVQPAVTPAPHGFKSTTVWELKNLPAIVAEPAMPPRQEITMRLALAPIGFKSWSDVGTWFHELNGPMMSTGTTAKDLVGRLTNGITDPKEKLRRVYEWVRDNVRYIAVEIGIGGYQAHAADEVLTNRYGDCKDMTILLCALATQAGLNVQPAYLSSWFSGHPDTTLPSPLQFDHVIAFAPDVQGGVWMDPTDKGAPFGQLPWYDQALPALVVDAEGGAAIHRTASTDAAQNRSASSWSVRLSPDGSAIVDGTEQLAGAAALDARMALRTRSAQQQRDWIEASLSSNAPGARLDTGSISGLTPCADPLVLNFRFHVPRLAAASDSILVLDAGRQMAGQASEAFHQPARRYPIRLAYAEVQQCRWDVQLPDGYEASPSVGRDSVVSSFGRIDWSWRSNGRTLILEYGTTIQGSDVPPEKYWAFRSFLVAADGRTMPPVLLRHSLPSGTHQ